MRIYQPESTIFPFRMEPSRLLEGLSLPAAEFVPNQESEVFPAGMCAERSLLFHAGACHADDPIEALAIASEPSERECYPCEMCIRDRYCEMW